MENRENEKERGRERERGEGGRKDFLRETIFSSKSVALAGGRSIATDLKEVTAK